MRTAQATVGDAATAAASDVATLGASRCTKSEASEAAGSPKGVPNSSSKRHFEKLLQGVSWFGGEKSTSVSGEAPAKASVGSESKQTGWTPAPVAAASATGAHGEGRADEAPEDLSEDEMVRPHRGAQTAESKPTQDGRSGDDSSSVHLQQPDDVGAPFAEEATFTFREQQQSDLNKLEAPCSSPSRTSREKKVSLQEPAGATAATTDYGASSAPTNKRGVAKSGGLHLPIPNKERRFLQFKRNSRRQNVSRTRKLEVEEKVAEAVGRAPGHCWFSLFSTPGAHYRAPRSRISSEELGISNFPAFDH
ncbi:hypothetical protein ENH_00023370 [Eimeria necatrix]|uniref:Uncharacterized protein n=1 Tax=Eimeria necatrix TaxID=51315 RepID=U6MRN3_9EIME|nr:hypothetical protein ENH_00023370 [Eimeria necatrix]CDJ66661.1 hypothetical protein ENH_00023370 [Eimeria necatrix]